MITIIVYKHQQGKPNSGNKNPKLSEKQPPTKLVYICSPLKGDIEPNRAKARIYCRFAFNKGYLPVAPHIYFTQFLNEHNKEERVAGLEYGLEIVRQCKQLWVFGERISEGMKAEIALAKELRLPIRYFDSDMEEISV